MAKQITLGEQYRAATLRGVDKLANTVKSTLGRSPSCQGVGQIQAVLQT
jgi:chaperonin GroEL (HSP60 family)